jgi:hypothetical protein
MYARFILFAVDPQDTSKNVEEKKARCNIFMLLNYKQKQTCYLEQIFPMHTRVITMSL